MKWRISGVSSIAIAALAILVGLIALGLAARPGMAQGGANITGPTVIRAPGHYLVTADFSGSIFIEASGVDLNLGGHTITVPRGYRASGVRVENGATNVSIENGTVIGQSATFGIGLFGGGHCSVLLTLDFFLGRKALPTRPAPVGRWACGAPSGGP